MPRRKDLRSKTAKQFKEFDNLEIKVLSICVVGAKSDLPKEVFDQVRAMLSLKLGIEFGRRLSAKQMENTKWTN